MLELDAPWRYAAIGAIVLLALVAIYVAVSAFRLFREARRRRFENRQPALLEKRPSLVPLDHVTTVDAGEQPAPPRHARSVTPPQMRQTTRSVASFYTNSIVSHSPATIRTLESWSPPRELAASSEMPALVISMLDYPAGAPARTAEAALGRADSRSTASVPLPASSPSLSSPSSGSAGIGGAPSCPAPVIAASAASADTVLDSPISAAPLHYVSARPAPPPRSSSNHYDVSAMDFDTIPVQTRTRLCPSVSPDRGGLSAADQKAIHHRFS